MRLLRLRTAGFVIVGALVAAPASATPISFGQNAYEYIPTLNLSISQATAAAQAMTYNGVSGHLVTILSAQEQAFVQSLITSVEHSVWIGASDTAVEGEWRWVTGERFWQGGSAGSPGPDVFYANWASGQPDDFQGGQDVATIFGGSVATAGLAGRWDDGGSGGGLGGGTFNETDTSSSSTAPRCPNRPRWSCSGTGLAAAAARRRARRRDA